MRIFKNKMMTIGIALLAIIGLFALLAPLFSSYDPIKPDWNITYLSPSCAHLFGTDALGRDMLIRIAHGTRVSFLIGILASLVSLIIGVSWGTIAGFKGGKTDGFMMRIVDILYGLPFMFFVIILIVYLGRSIYNLFIALGAIQWLTMSRIVRSEVLSVKNREYIESARALGLGNISIMVKHIIPNIIGPVLAYSFLLIPAVIIEESFLSFLGLGVQPPQASLGTLINNGAGNLDNYWWLLFIPSAILISLLFALNFFGEGLRDALDPKNSGKKI